MLKDNHHFTIHEYDMMIPYERDIYVSMLVDKLKKEEADRMKR